MKYSVFIFASRSLFNRRLDKPNKNFWVPDQQFAKMNNPKLQQNFQPNQYIYLDICCLGNKVCDVTKRINATFGVWMVDCACCMVLYDVILYVVE